MLNSYNLTRLVLFFCLNICLLQAQDSPNILLIIADDLGVDVSNGYHQGNLMPTTPTLDQLRSEGITFENVFASPVCSPTRAGIMSGKYGIKTGVSGVPGNLNLEHSSIFDELASRTNNLYADAVIGKWHLSQPVNLDHPSLHGVDYFMGPIGGAVMDYYQWEKTENGVTTTEDTYATTAFTNAAIDWVNDQNQPWFLWFAHIAPHTPIHLPPSEMYSINATGTNFRKYIAMIESVDYELNRLLNAMSEEDRANTVIVYIGDNGTPGNVIQDYPDGHSKGSLYQGGIRVPMIIAGAGVSRQGERESALIHVNDLHATILEIAGADLPGGLYNSLSFEHLLNNEEGATRDYNYSDVTGNEDSGGYTIRGPQYKLINFTNGSQEMYDLLADSLEFNNLLTGTLTSAQIAIKSDLEAEAIQQRDNWSCRDHIQNGDEDGIDCGGSFCGNCTTSVDNPDYQNALKIYPNPANSFFTIESEEEIIQKVRVLNILGQVLVSKEGIRKTSERIDISAFPPQVLWLEVSFENRKEVVKVVKR